jgi:outer membrane receptor protein involved in Fe transport
MSSQYRPAARARRNGSAQARPSHARPPALWPLARALHALGWLGLPLIALAPLAHAQDSTVAQAGTSTRLDRVEVIGISPLPGQGVDRNVLPYATQLIKRERIDAAQAANQLDFLNRSVPGVQVNDIQGSPFQGDLTYRGFRASPLIGAGQGLSVFLDGVRINEPFGDVINFDLIPEFAVNTISLVPGANPAFGLNSLGGALAYTTHDGRSAPGVRAELSGGSFGRKRVDLSYGASDDAGWHRYVAATGFDERGWRDDSDGKLGQFFGKLGHDDGATGWSVGLLLGRSDLVGNGLVPAYTIDDGALARDLYFHRREAVYTFPDETKNKLAQLSFNLQHQLDAASSVSALVYARKSTRDTVNGDEADAPDDGGSAGNPEPVGNNAAFNTTATRQTGYGAALSYAAQRGAHQYTVGASIDTARVRYRQLEQEGFFTPSRGVIPAEGEPVELAADVSGRSTSIGLYATDTWRLAERTHLTATARYNRSRVSNRLTVRDDDTGIVEDKPAERFSYQSINPALGLAHRLDVAATAPTVFANLARNTRVPTVIELGCADPEEPCRLPAGLQADPFLEQVKSTTVEAYRTVNRDDILFRSVNVNGQLGYFANFPKTRNQGLDAEFSAALGGFEFALGYSFLDATYQAAGVLRQGERNVTIVPGTRIAGLPRHTLKLAADWRGASGLGLGADLLAVGPRGVSGNEDGLLEDPEAGEEAQARRLALPGYAVLNLRTSWKPGKSWELYANLNNVFDRRYQSFGALAETQFSPDGNYTGESRDALFVAPGAPRAVFVGLRLRY